MCVRGARNPQASCPLALVAVLGGASGSRPTRDTSLPGARAVVEWVNDGDTLTLTGGAKVRLVQIDAPELETDCYGRAALEALVALAPKGTRVTLASDPKLDERDRFGRLLRYVFVRAERQRRARPRGRGVALLLPQGARPLRRDLLDAVDEARSARRGYWGACPGAELNTGLGSVTGTADRSHARAAVQARRKAK